MKKSELKEMIKKAISEEYPQYKQNNNWDEDYEKISREIEYGINPEADEIDLEDLEAAADYYDDLEEAKKKEETEIEVEDTEEIKPMNDVASDGENMKDLQSNLEAALEIAKQIGDEKLIDQIGNTLTFFIRAYVVGRETRNNDGEEINESLSYLDLVKGNTYTYTGGAEPLTVTYIGLTKDNTDKKVGSSMGKGFLFQWEKGTYFELNNRTIREYISEKDNVNESFKRMQKIAGLTK